MPGASESSGLGPLEVVAGVGVVVEATVVGFRGPTGELGANGGVEYDGRSENADDWTTPLGLPVIVLGEIEVVEVVGGSPAAEAVAARAGSAATAGTGEVSAPVGVYTEGERYQL